VPLVHAHQEGLDDAGRPAIVGLNAIARFDFVEGREVARHVFDAQTTTQEPFFVPRGRAADEGDGWLVMIVNRWATMLNDLVILDTADLSGDPVAVASLPMRVHSGIHTLWIGDDELAGA
jgi:carotenoid cleavage dioxygenase